MRRRPEDFYSREVPDIKAAIDDAAGPTASLGDGDSPELLDLGNRLLAAYVVDTGDALEYVQDRHLREAGIDGAALHATAVKNLAVFASGRTRL